jgi:hypothetical protein
MINDFKTFLVMVKANHVYRFDEELKGIGSVEEGSW